LLDPSHVFQMQLVREDGSMVPMSEAALESLRLLVEEGLQPMRMYEMKEEGVRTSLLHTAAQAGDREVVDLLLAHGGDALMHDGFGEMPHHCAAQSDRLEMAQCLLDRFAIPTDAECDRGIKAGTTALHAAARKGRMRTVRWLISRGADPRKEGRCLDNIYRRASTLADHSGFAEVGRFLRACEDKAEARVERALAARRAAGIALAALAAEAEGPVERPPPLGEYLDAHAPDALLCPITHELVEDPVVLAVDGCTYSRTAIERHFAVRRQGG